MKALSVVMVVSGLVLLVRQQAKSHQQVSPLPPTAREYGDRLAYLLEHALLLGNKPLWNEVSEKCRGVGREDLPEHKRKKWPHQAELLDRA